jgi:hypothetical protein
MILVDMRLYFAIALIVLSLLSATLLPQTMFFMACLLSLASLRLERSLIAVFFALAALHCIGGYFIAFRGESSLYWLFNQHEFWFSQATLAIALGLFSMSTVYRLSDLQKTTWIGKLSIDEDRLRVVTRIVVVAAGGLVFYMYSQFSVIDLALQNFSDIGRLRYLGSESAMDVYTVGRVSDALLCALPLLWLLKTRKLDYVIYGFGLLAMIPPLRRAQLFAVLLLPFLVRAKEINYRKLAITFVVLLSIYVVSQFYFLTLGEGDSFNAVASALPEARDLGWAMKLMDGHYLHGVTFIQPFDPFPAIIDTWKASHSMGYITATLLGVDPDERAFGGLRVTMAGEAFMNFWFFGPVLLGSLLGWGAAWAARSMNRSVDLPSRYLAVTAFVWICFWLYMGGTQALATLKFNAVILLLMYSLAFRRSVPAVLYAARPAAQV